MASGKKYNMYDPARNAYCEITADQANKLVDEAEKIKPVLIANGDRSAA